ncbi:Uncharacterised protein [Candidatus Ornithobacterium hominis]|uniref:Uncharacterized protein n=1 Tax=Candidatus Ornithobacterium hominis TaxID=2497989 RepID=A0A383U2W1_9FLAO|nr:hypothetical protein [Candidatus Ornithobacterium hominis]MCT7904990.1 hypothetical protein [Candidatus Ornithobacterium hominis]SZD73840.1 Uncharacterised protein [Candidatus Ornithobacterium hominis]SZD74175.1 Uncharacterised protein [Candidatus Ornithobacterium hominis]
MRIFVVIFSVFLLFSCQPTGYSESNTMSSFANEFEEDDTINMVQFKARVDKNKTEIFDFNVQQSGEFFIDFNQPIEGIVLVIVNDKTKKVIEKIKSNQIINLKKGRYNLITISKKPEPKNREIVFAISRY